MTQQILPFPPLPPVVFEPPVQRLWRCGPAALNDVELLALLLGSGLEMGQRVLQEGLSGLRQLDENPSVPPVRPIFHHSYPLK